MNEQPWFHGQGQKAEPKLDDDYFGEDETEPCQSSEGDYGGDDEPIRFGNNRKHVKKSVAKAKRKAAKKSKQRNRK